MKLFTKDIDKKLFAQYSKGAELEGQKVIAKIFNPYGRGIWYLLNSDPEDPDYIWAIVDLIDVEMGSVSRMELENIKVPPFNLHLEIDLYFDEINAKELWDGLMEGKQYAEGGTTNKEPLFKVVGKKEGQLVDISEIPMIKSDCEIFIKKEGINNHYNDVAIIPYHGTKEPFAYTQQERYFYGNQSPYQTKRAEGGEVQIPQEGDDVRGFGHKYGTRIKEVNEKNRTFKIKNGDYWDSGDSWISFDKVSYSESHDAWIRKMEEGGEIDWGADLGNGITVGTDVNITDPKSLFKGKTGFITGKVGKDYLVTISVDGNDRNVVVGKKGFDKIDEPFAEGGKIKNQYEGKTAKKVYELWDYGQKYEFFKDHFQNSGVYTNSEFKNLPSKKYDELDKTAKDVLDKHIAGGQYANGGEIMKHKHLTNVTIELIEPTSKGWKVKQIETHSVGGRKLSTPKEKVAYYSKAEIKDLFESTMAKGGTFVQGVKAIEKQLTGKKVPGKYQSKYGKKYNKTEAHEAATNIKGAMAAKEKIKNALKRRKK